MMMRMVFPFQMNSFVHSIRKSGREVGETNALSPPVYLYVPLVDILSQDCC